MIKQTLKRKFTAFKNNLSIQFCVVNNLLNLQIITLLAFENIRPVLLNIFTKTNKIIYNYVFKKEIKSNVYKHFISVPCRNISSALVYTKMVVQNFKISLYVCRAFSKFFLLKRFSNLSSASVSMKYLM